MSVIDAEAKARAEYKSNPDKVLSKLTYSYCQRKVLIPYEMEESKFNKMITDYKIMFPNGTTLDALWAFNGQCKIYQTRFLSRIPLALGQIAEFEGRFEIALKNFFECLVLEIVEDLENFSSLAAYHPEYKNDPIIFLRRGGNTDYLKKGSLVGDRISQIIKKSNVSEREIFKKYSFNGVIPNCVLTVDQINNFIEESISD